MDPALLDAARQFSSVAEADATGNGELALVVRQRLGSGDPEAWDAAHAGTIDAPAKPSKRNRKGK